MFKKLLFTVCMLLSTLASAWVPTENINVLIGFASGSGNEISMRMLSAIIAENDKSAPPFIIKNMPGADSVISLNKLVESPNDGYTISIPSHMSLYVTTDIWQRDVKKYEYDSFVSVMGLGKSPLALVANIDSKINTPAEFAKLIQTSTKPVNVAVGGGAHRITYEHIMLVGKGRKEFVQVIDFNGPMQAVAAVAGVGIEFGIMPVAIAKSLLDAKKIKLIGLTGTHKIALLPDAHMLNTVFPKTNVYAAWTLALPPKTPADVVEWYTKTFTSALQSPRYKEWATQNYIFIDESELTPVGLSKNIEELRSAFMPIIKKLQAEVK